MIVSNEELAFVPLLIAHVNYDKWNIRLSILLTAKGLIRFVDGNTYDVRRMLEERYNGNRFMVEEEFNRLDAEAKYIILQTISPNLHSRIESCKTAKDMYNALLLFT